MAETEYNEGGKKMAPEKFFDDQWNVDANKIKEALEAGEIMVKEAPRKEEEMESMTELTIVFVAGDESEEEVEDEEDETVDEDVEDPMVDPVLPVIDDMDPDEERRMML